VTFVVDHSVALTWCFESERTTATTELLRRVGSEGGFAPGIWPIEALNGLLSAERRRRIDAAKRHVLLGFLAGLPITIDDETAGRAWAGTARLAEQCGLTAYDAAYLELAQRLDLPLASLDRQLRTAASGLAIPTLGL
jgi:predicted nucleic acid-binding protein